jgi:hypothetical protein
MTTLRPAAPSWEVQVPTYVMWVVERTGIRLVSLEGGEDWIGYPEAALWELLTRGVSRAYALRVFGAVAGTGPAGAEASVREWLGRWVEAGFLWRTSR